MRYLKTNTATRVTVGPFLDKTDGVTPETALTVTSCKLTFTVDDGGVPTLVLDTNPTASGGSNDMVHITGDDAGFYDLELAAANVNYTGRAMLALTDATTHCPVFHEFTILPAKVYDSLISGTDNLETDNVQWLGGTIATPTQTGVPEVDVTYVNGSAASGSGTPDVNVVTIAADAITATSIQANAITAAKIADAAIDNATFAADVGSTAIATNVIGIAAKKGVVDALNVDTYAEPGQEAPAATNTLVKKIGYLYKNWRNRKTQTATAWKLFADDATTVDQKATVADDATTASKTEIASGP